MFEGLRSYFNSQEGCSMLIKNCFEDTTIELYLKFVCRQLKYLNQTILKQENESIGAVEVVLALSELKQNVLAKKENNFLPSQAMVLLRKLGQAGEVNVERFYDKQETFMISVNHIWVFMMELMKICILIFGLTLRRKYRGHKCLNLQKRSASC